MKMASPFGDIDPCAQGVRLELYSGGHRCQQPGHQFFVTAQAKLAVHALGVGLRARWAMGPRDKGWACASRRGQTQQVGDEGADDPGGMARW